MNNFFQTIQKRWSSLTQKEKLIVSAIGIVLLAVIVTPIVLMANKKPVQKMEQVKQNSNVNTSTNTNQNTVVAEPIINSGEVSPISGIACENRQQRPIAVMMAADKAARPLSGLSKADLVFEMPVITGSVTRLMGLFVCNTPDEVGSIRSARHDFISLSRGFNAIFVHWGGSHYALDELKTGVPHNGNGQQLSKIDDIDALTQSGPFFRKSTVPAPHNGFASLPRVIEKAKSLNYSLTNTFTGYTHLTSDEITAQKATKSGTLYVGFASIYATSWKYDPATNTYTRYWANQKDSDKLTNEAVTPSNIVVFKTGSRQIEGQYNDVDTEGIGSASFYLNGQEIAGTWEKKDRTSKLTFKDKEGQDIKFVPGQIFVQIIESTQTSKWESD